MKKGSNVFVLCDVMRKLSINIKALFVCIYSFVNISTVYCCDIFEKVQGGEKKVSKGHAVLGD